MFVEEADTNNIENAFFNVKVFGALGDGSGATAATIFPTLAACQVVYPFATSLSQTLDFLGAEAANIAASENGGGIVYWPPGHYRTTLITDQHPWRSFVTYTGAGFSSWLDYAGNCFLSYGMDPTDMPLLTWKGLNNVSAGAQTIALTTPSDAANFSPGQITFLTSLATDTPGVYCFMEVIKITAVNTGTGILTLEEPIEDAVTGAQISTNTYEPVPAFLVPEGCHTYNLRLSANGSGLGGQPWALNGAYKCFAHHCWIAGQRAFSHNGPTKCKFEDMYCVVGAQPALYNYGYAIEVQQGGYKSEYRRLKIAVVNTTGDMTFYGSSVMFAPGARSRDITIDDIDVDAPEINLHNCYDCAGAARTNLKNIRLLCANFALGFNISYNFLGSYPLQTTNKINGFTIQVVGTWALGGIFSDASNANPRSDEVVGFSVIGTQATTGGQSPGSFLWEAAANCVVRDSNVPGTYLVTGSPAGARIFNSITGGAADTTTRAAVNVVGSPSIGALAPPSPLVVTNVQVQSTTPNNVVAQLAFPDNFVWALGDRVHFRIVGAFTGTANVKNLTIADSTGAILTLQGNAANQNSFYIDGDIDITAPGGSTITYRIVGAVLNGSTSVVVQNNTAGADNTAGIKFNLDAWVANAADAVYIIKADFQYARAEASLNGGATSAAN